MWIRGPAGSASRPLRAKGLAATLGASWTLTCPTGALPEALPLRLSAGGCRLCHGRRRPLPRHLPLPAPLRSPFNRGDLCLETEAGREGCLCAPLLSQLWGVCPLAQGCLGNAEPPPGGLHSRLMRPTGERSGGGVCACVAASLPGSPPPPRG